VPRRRTELLARTTLARVAAHHVVVEMCCGVAPVAAVLDGSAAEIHAADVSAVALACAARNAPFALLHQGDLFDALPKSLARRIDVLVANAPYVPTGRISEMPSEARDHEPHGALDGGADGVDLHRRLAQEAPRWLAPGGVLLIETSPGQVPLTTGAMQDAGLTTAVETDVDIGGWVAVGVRSARPAAEPA
jgi:release factor glutamine methyltransferase